MKRERQGEEAQGPGGRGKPARSGQLQIRELEGEGSGEEADCRQLLVIPAGALEVVGTGSGERGNEEFGARKPAGCGEGKCDDCQQRQLG